MTNPLVPRAPRRVEALLESLGADHDFTSEVLGDLAEEFALRVRWDGRAAARRWYYREALRTAPYLLADWARNFAGRDASSVVRAVVAGTVAGLGLDVFIKSSMMWLTFHVTGITFNAYWNHWMGLGSLIPYAIYLGWTMVVGLGSGFAAGVAGRRAPIVHAVIVTGIWAALMLGTGMRVPRPFLFSNVASMAVSMLCGGVLAAFHARRPETAETR